MSNPRPEAAPATAPNGAESTNGGRRARAIAAKLALALLSVVATVVLLELGARWLLVDPGLTLWNPNPCIRWSTSLGQEFKPNCASNLANTDFRTNSIGLRGDELADDGAPRILAIGDSCTWGWGVAEGESYPGFLQRTLDYNAGERRYRVINAGVPGFTSYQGLVYLRERGASLRPQLVLIGYGFNDQLRSGDVRELIERSRTLQPLFRLDEALGTQSRLYRWARYKLKRPLPPGLAPRVSLDQYLANIEAMVTLAREIGAQPVIISFERPFNPYASAEHELAARLRVPMIFYQGPRLDIVHPTADGYSRFAGALYERLRKEGYL